jgi:hypothetical protein
MKKNSFNNKVYNYNLKVYKKFKLLYLFNLFFNTKFIIFFNYKQLLNKEMYILNNELFKLKAKSYVLLKKYKSKLFNFDFKFLGSFMFCIFINSYDTFFKICNLLFEKKILFFFSFKKKFSNIINNQYQYIGGNVFITIHFLIFRLI